MINKKCTHIKDFSKENIEYVWRKIKTNSINNAKKENIEDILREAKETICIAIDVLALNDNILRILAERKSRGVRTYIVTYKQTELAKNMDYTLIRYTENFNGSFCLVDHNIDDAKLFWSNKNIFDSNAFTITQKDKDSIKRFENVFNYLFWSEAKTETINKVNRAFTSPISLYLSYQYNFNKEIFLSDMKNSADAIYSEEYRVIFTDTTKKIIFPYKKKNDIESVAKDKKLLLLSNDNSIANFIASEEDKEIFYLPENTDKKITLALLDNVENVEKYCDYERLVDTNLLVLKNNNDTILINDNDYSIQAESIIEIPTVVEADDFETYENANDSVRYKT